MGEGTAPSYWSDIDRRHRAGILLGAAVVLAGVVAAGVALTGREPAAVPGGETSRTITPAEETAEATVTLPSYDETPAAEPEVPGEATPPPAAAPGRAPVVAYRRAGVLCISAEDGTGERQLVASAAGVYSLSPDGGALALVDASAATLVIVNTATGAHVAVGPAAQDQPSWSPDSAWLVYTAAGPKVTRVVRSGAGATSLFAGSMPSVSVADQAVVGLDASGRIAVSCGGTVSRVPATGTVTGLATDGVTVYYGTLGPDGSGSLRAVGVSGSGDRVLAPRSQAARAVTFGDLLLSPDASRLVFAERGDDGYSRLFAVPAGGGDVRPLSVRRDCYPVRWTADGASVLFIEGNVIQGDPTALMGVDPSGRSRRLLSEGADR